MSAAAGLFHSARFATSVAESVQLNAAELAMLPEVAFVGRSNAGKSSAINTLTQQRQLAFASKTPGRTQLLNFFALSRRLATGRSEAVAYLVDLPDYGFAKVDDATRIRWDQLVGGYLQSRRMLVGVVLVMDARRPLLGADEELIGSGRGGQHAAVGLRCRRVSCGAPAARAGPEKNCPESKLGAESLIVRKAPAQGGEAGDATAHANRSTCKPMYRPHPFDRS